MKKLIFIALVAGIVLFSLGCISPEKKSENVTTLRIGYQPSTHQIAEMVAAEKGWWAEDLKPFGVVEIKEFEFPSGPPEMQAMLAGDLDVAYVGTAPPISAISQGLDAKIVAAVNINGSDLVFQSWRRLQWSPVVSRNDHRHLPTGIDPGYSHEEVAGR